MQSRWIETRTIIQVFDTSGELKLRDAGLSDSSQFIRERSSAGLAARVGVERNHDSC
jgi:hypothetical protein